ncbi:MAG: T9SS type A sorting domain-containing protein [Chitinivibrionales bacterium]|nr:T9SS type A sorting domain-containing protein [Chitinivibrionales bacterium]
MVASLSSNPQLVWTAIAVTGSNERTVQSFCREGDYVFASLKYGDINVFDASTGEYLQTLTPGPEVNSNTGWHDIQDALRVYKRPNGEYLVFAEEDGWAKVLMYRWCPEGTCDDVTEADNRAVPASSGGQSPMVITNGRIVIPRDKSISELRIVDLSGRTVYRTSTNKSTIALPRTLSPGIYCITIQSGTGSVRRRFVLR